MNKILPVYLVFFSLSLISLPGWSDECSTETSSSPFSVNLSGGDSKCYLLPERTNLVMCEINYLVPGNSGGDDPTLTITQKYQGPGIVPASTQKRIITESGQRFSFPGTDDPDTMQLTFQLSSESKPKYKGVSFSCKYNIYKASLIIPKPIDIGTLG